MNAERRAQILADVRYRAGLMQATHTGFRDAVETDWRKAAAAEHEEYMRTVHGRRAPKSEKDRIKREIQSEHEAAWRLKVEKALTLSGYSRGAERPVLEGYVRECQQPVSASEAYNLAVSDRGSADRPLMLALLEQVTRRDIRAELARLPPSAAFEVYQRAVTANGITPDAVVRRAVIIEEAERRDGRWNYDPKGESAEREHAASQRLSELIRQTKAARVPRELTEALNEAAKAQHYTEQRRVALKLQVRPLDEVLALETEDEGA